MGCQTQVSQERRRNVDGAGCLVTGAYRKIAALDNEKWLGLVRTQTSMLTMTCRIAGDKPIASDVPKTRYSVSVNRISFAHAKSDREPPPGCQSDIFERVTRIDGAAPVLLG